MITHWFLKSQELYFVLKDQKLSYRKKNGFKKISITYLLPIVGRPQAEQICYVSRSIGRSTCPQSTFEHFGRPGDRPTARALLSMGSGRPPQLTDKEFSSLVGNSGRPLSPMVENPTVGGRPAGRLTEDFSSVFFPNGYILFCLFWVFFQQLFWVFYSCFHPL